MYQIPELSKFPNLFHAFSTKDEGNMANSILGNVVNFKEVITNRTKFLSKIQVDINKCVCIWVQHSDSIIEPSENALGVSMKEYTKALKVDSLMTNQKGIFLFLLVADCLPIILYDPKKEVLCLVHAGWRGIDLEIIKKAVKRLEIVYKTKASDLIVGIGPCVHKESFIKVNPDQKNNPKWQAHLKDMGRNKYSVDLIGFAEKQLSEVGVMPGSIFVSEVDTARDSRFFSHVRDANLPIEKQGRFACVVGLV